ncbi:hypothetical protein B9Z65_2079 [Elsinoe australis]|uniref:Uncharacterized protein n=1 Tax=Elsinoe australis TaxID=40998 RepID=A0A2P7YMZ9_9PEZI|nr:hypothetical protein B9Z65_2079 [Elsinoe australis]
MKFTSLFAFWALTATSQAASVPTRQPLDLGNFHFPSSESINATDISKRSLVTRGVDTAGIRCNSKGPTLRQEQRLCTDWTAALWSYANYVDPSEHIFNKEGIDMSNYKDVNQLTGKYAATTSQQVGYGMPFRFMLAGYACDEEVTCGVGLPKFSGWYRYKASSTRKVDVTISGGLMTEKTTVS